MMQSNPDNASEAVPPARPPSPSVVRGWTAIRNGCQTLAQSAERELLIFSRDLDPDLYDQAPFIAEIRRLALAYPRLPVRALLFDARAPVIAGHRMVALARRLGSRIAIRRLGEDFRDRPDAFLIADARGYCLRRLADRPEATLAPRAPAQAARLRAEFERMWERSDGDAELLQLSL